METIKNRIAAVPGDLYRFEKGVTVVELLIVFGIIGCLAGIATPKFLMYQEKVKVTVAITDISTLGKEITSYYLANGSYPESLDDTGLPNTTDPWGNPYQYLVLDGDKQGARKDEFLKPINSDFDLYSMGPDGATNKNLNSGASQDDVIRCNDGGYVGTVENY